MDISAVEWSQHKPQTLQRLRDALDKEFEYVGNPLSLAGFRSAVTKFLKSEHCQFKARYLSGNVEAPVHVKDDQWKRLVQYWQTDAQKTKSEKMAAARQWLKTCSGASKRGKLVVQS